MPNWWDDIPEAQSAAPQPAPIFNPSATPGAPGNWWEAVPASQNATPPPKADQLLPNAPYDATDVAVHGMTFGLSDPLRAAKSAGIDWLRGHIGGATDPATGQPLGFDYENRAEAIARGRRQYEAEHPILSTGASLAGGLALGGGLAREGAAALSLPRQILAGTGIGAAGGAITGAADTPEDPLMGAAYGAPVGAAFGGAAPITGRVLGTAGTWASNYFQPAVNAGSNAINTLRGLVNRDIAAGQPSLERADERLNNSTAPLTLADIYPSVKRYLGSLYDSWSPHATTVFSTLNNRDMSAADRILYQLDQRSVTGPPTFNQHLTMQQQQAAAAGPAYDAFRAAPPLNPDLVAPDGELTGILNTPAGRAGVRAAQEIAGNRRIDLGAEGIGLDADGNVQFTRVPSWQGLDYVKQGIDADIARRFPRDQTTGRRDLGTAGAAMMDARGSLVSLMDRENPLYATARATFSGPQTSMEALDMGANSLKPGISLAEQQHQFSRLDPGDQDFYRLGANNALRDQVLSVADAGDETKRIANSPMMRAKLRPLFGSQDDYDAFIAHLNDERTIFQTGVDMTGNSATARRMGAMGATSPAPSPSNAIPMAVGSLVAGGGIPHAVALAAGTAASHRLGAAWRGASELMAGNSPEMQNAAVGMGFAPGQAARQVIGLLQQPQAPRTPTWLPGAVLGGQVGGLLGGDQANPQRAMDYSWRGAPQ